MYSESSVGREIHLGAMQLIEVWRLVVILVFADVFSIQGANVFIPNKNRTFIEDQQVTLYCNTSQLTNVSVTWVKEGVRGKILSHSNKFTFNRSVLRTDAGCYICNATNGSAYFTDQICISVKYAPMINLTKRHVVLENTSISIACTATGNPLPMVTFVKDKTTLKTTKKQVTLEFKPVYRNATGSYNCTASNGVGRNATATIYLDVQYPPEITLTDLHPINCWLGKHVRTRCNVTANPPPNITWYKNETAIASSNELVVNITSVEQFGTYRCVAENSRGMDSRNVILNRTRFPPDAPEITNNATSIESRNFTLTWSKPNDNGSPIKNYFVFKQQMYENGSKDSWEKRNVSASSIELRFLLDWRASYRFYVSARNGQGKTKGHVKNVTVIEEPRTKVTSPHGVNWIVIGACAGGGLLLLIIIIVVITVCYYRKRSTNHIPPPCPKQHNFRHSILMDDLSDGTPKIRHSSDRYKMSQNTWNPNHMDTSEPEQAQRTAAIYDNVAFIDKSVEGWEIPRENVTIEKVIGKGAFCQVAKAFVTGIGTVAVKMIRTKGTNHSSNREDLLSEYKLLQKLGTHANVIMVMGGVTTSDPIMVLFEYVPYGDLLGYLRRSRGLTDTYYTDPDYQPSSTLTSKQLLRFAREISDGMAFISSKKIIHRDLAARNVLVGQDETCKITDFGMARDVKNDDIYQKKTRGRLPVKWTAYEALLYGFYSIESDVWSYAIVLYEIFTIGGSPYPDMDPRKIAQKIDKGYRMPKPEHLDDEIYALMTECWKTTPDQRPSFSSISSTLRRLQRHEKDYIHMNQYDVNLYANLDEI